MRIDDIAAERARCAAYCRLPRRAQRGCTSIFTLSSHRALLAGHGRYRDDAGLAPAPTDHLPDRLRAHWNQINAKLVDESALLSDVRSGDLIARVVNTPTALLADPGIVRNRLKVASAIQNARAFLKVQDEFGGFDAYIWRFVEGRAYVAFDGHRSDDDEPYAYVTEDFGQTWKALRGNLPTGSTRVLREDTQNQDLLFLGSEFAAWASIDRGV